MSLASSWWSIATKLSFYWWDNESSHDYGDGEPELIEVWDINEADLMTSEKHTSLLKADQFGSAQKEHLVAIDLDVPAVLVPSSTPGHSHLLIDVTLPWHKYSALLNALEAAGIIEPGYNEISQKRKHTDLRTPWTNKPGVQETEEQKQFHRSIVLYEKRADDRAGYKWHLPRIADVGRLTWERLTRDNS
jgi:hypothetical protein